MTPDSDRNEIDVGQSTDDGESKRIVELAVPADEFVLGDAMRAVPDAIVELERLIPSDIRPFPYLWARCEDLTAFEETAAADPTVESIALVAQFEPGALYEIRWQSPSTGITPWIRDAEVPLVSARGSGADWIVEMRIESRATLDEFQAYCDANDVRFDLQRLFEVGESTLARFDVSRKQREVIEAALEMGYFEIPRQSTLGEIADELGISTKSASERLRRGQNALLTNTVTAQYPLGVGLNTT